MKILKSGTYQGSTGIIKHKSIYIFSLLIVIALSGTNWTETNNKKMPYIWTSHNEGIHTLYIGRIALGYKKI